MIMNNCLDSENSDTDEYNIINSVITVYIIRIVIAQKEKEKNYFIMKDSRLNHYIKVLIEISH